MVVADVPPSGAAPGGPGGPGGPAHENDASRTSAAQRLRDTNSQALASSRMLTSPAGRTPPLRTPTRDVRHARTERVRRHRERLLALGPLSRDFAACIVVRARRLLHESAGLNQEKSIMRTVTKLLLLGFLWAASARGEADPKAARAWKAKCASCHGADGAGQTDQGKKLKVDDMT